MPRFDPRPAAIALAEAFRNGEPIAALPEHAAPRTGSQGTRVASAMLAELGFLAVGFRAVPAGQPGPLLEGRLVASGTMLPAAALPRGLARPALFALLAKPLPAHALPYSQRLVLGALGSLRAAIDLAASRLVHGAPTRAIAAADLSGLGQVVLAPPGRGTADPAALRVTWNGAPALLDATPALMQAAEAARLAGGLPAGAALLAVLEIPPLPATQGSVMSTRIVGAGRAEVTLV